MNDPFKYELLIKSDEDQSNVIKVKYEDIRPKFAVPNTPKKKGKSFS